MAKNKGRREKPQELPQAEGPEAEEQLPSCCRPGAKREGRGFLLGLVYGLIPHTFCILFIVLSVVGATAATSVIRRFLYVPYLFQIIVALSLVFATVSAALYLKRNGLLSLPGIRFKWKYLSVLYATTVGINLLFFLVVFPLVANAGFSREAESPAGLASTRGVAANSGSVTLQVSIPCSGHAPLVMDELKKVDGITGIRYRFPNSFQVTYDASKLTVQEILAIDLFKEFPARAE